MFILSLIIAPPLLPKRQEMYYCNNKILAHCGGFLQTTHIFNAKNAFQTKAAHKPSYKEREHHVGNVTLSDTEHSTGYYPTRHILCGLFRLWDNIKRCLGFNLAVKWITCTRLLQLVAVYAFFNTLWLKGQSVCSN